MLTIPQELNQAQDLSPAELEALARQRRTSHLQQDAENRNCLNLKRRKLFEEQEEDECIASEGENNDRYKYSSAKKWRKKAADFDSVAPCDVDYDVANEACIQLPPTIKRGVEDCFDQLSPQGDG